jgi:pimeloyl-ACP methyl ester carboxylesterase
MTSAPTVRQSNAPGGFSRRFVLAGGAGLAAFGSGKGFAMQAENSGYASVDGLRIYYEIHGGPLTRSAEPFVLLPGGMMAIETAFGSNDLLPRLSRLRPVIAIEQQGHGHTGDREGPVTLDRMVDDVAGVMSHLGVSRAHLVGHSLGAMTATGVAIRHPDRAASVTPISGIYNLEGYQPELVTLQRDPTHQPSPELMKLLPTEADFAAWQAHYKRSAPRPEAFEQVLAKLNVLLTNWPGWTPAELATIRAPFLVIVGDNDFTRVEHAAEMARLIPGAQLAVLPGATHMHIIDRGSWIVPMIEARIG